MIRWRVELFRGQQIFGPCCQIMHERTKEYIDDTEVQRDPPIIIVLEKL